MLGVLNVSKDCHHVMPSVSRSQNRSGCGLSKGLVLVSAAGSADMTSREGVGVGDDPSGWADVRPETIQPRRVLTAYRPGRS